MTKPKKEALTRTQWLQERAALQQRVAELEAQLQRAQAGGEQQLRFTETLLAAIPTPAFFKDVQGRYLGCNDAFTAQMGVTAEELKGKTVYDLWPGEHAQIYHQQDLELMQHPERQVYEFKVRDKNGQDRDVIFAKNVFCDETGQVAGLVGAYVDITERKRVEEALRESQALFQSLVESMPQNVFSKDLEGRFTFANQQYCKTIDQSLDDILGKTDFELHPSPLAHKYRKDDQQVMQQRRIFQTIEEHQALGGEKSHVQMVKAPLFDAAGQVSGMLGIFWDITASVQMQEALKTSQEYVRSIIDSSLDMIIAVNMERRITQFNRAAQETFGYRLEEVLGKHVDMLYADPQEGLAVHQTTVQEGQCIREVLDKRKDGRIFPCHLSASCLRDARGELVGVMGISRDITARKQAEEALRQERDLSRALADAAAMINRTLDPDEVMDRILGQVSQVVPNDAANVMLVEKENRARIARWRGYERFRAEVFVSTAVFDLDVMPNLRQMIETGEPIVVPDTLTYPGWVHTPELARLHSYAGAPIRVRGVVVGFLNVDSATPDFFTPLHADILRAFADHAAIALENAQLYRAAQQELAERKQAQEALRASEERYRRLFERSNDAIFLVDRRTGRYQEANAAAEKLTGRSAAELQQLTTLDVTPEGAQERLAHVLTAQQTLDMGEVRYLRPDGVTRTALLDVVPLDDRTVFGIARDITERQEIEERLQRQDRLAAIGQLAAGIAHDFRNLLTTIILYAQLGQRRPDLPPAVAQHLEIIIGEARKAADLVRQILDFGRRTEIERSPLDLVAFVGSVVAVLQRILPETIHITFDVGPGACIVEGDAGRLQQTLTNLALNARDAMPDGGSLRIGVTRITVEPGAAPPLPEMVEALAPPAWICLSIADTGVGMTEEVRAHLFEPFFTTKEEGKGVGLGLAQVYGIVQLHAGYIDVETEVGQGTAFHIYLPAAAAAEDTTAETISDAPRGLGETILLVEDNAGLRKVGASILTALGYRVLTAANGREALALHQAEGPIALLVTDLVMPEMGGKALVQALRHRVPHLKALAMSGYTAEASVETLRAAGFLEVVRKPFDAATLARAVRRALDEGGAKA
ncbi:MAG TPA: PAS domain S-box protein [Chloroflexi bacterium]|nr:PAS domain S-box protein [Chloroflexota bacterium]